MLARSKVLQGSCCTRGGNMLGHLLVVPTCHSKTTVEGARMVRGLKKRMGRGQHSTNGHPDTMTDLAQRVESVKTLWITCKSSKTLQFILTLRSCKLLKIIEEENKCKYFLNKYIHLFFSPTNYTSANFLLIKMNQNMIKMY